MSARRDARRAEYAWKALAGIMLMNGGLALLAPRFLARRLAVDPVAQPAMLYVLRMFGIRTILIASELVLEPERRAKSLKRNVAIHACDATAAGIAAVMGQLPMRAALMAGAISTLNTAFSVVASTYYSTHDAVLAMNGSMTSPH